MFGELVGFVAIVALMVVVWRQQQRLRVLEFDLEGLRTAFLAHREKYLVRQSWQAPQFGAPAAEAIAIPGEHVASEIRGSHRRCRRRLAAQAAACRGWPWTPQGDASPEAAAPPPGPQPAEAAGPWTKQGDASPEASNTVP